MLADDDDDAEADDDAEDAALEAESRSEGVAPIARANAFIVSSIT